MIAYIARRVLWSTLQLAVVLVITFFLVRILPGNPAQAIAAYGSAGATQQAVQNLEAQFHLDKPLPVQFGFWLRDLAHGSLGESIVDRVSVTSLLGGAVPKTGLLAIGALLIGWPLGIVFGGLAARRRGLVGTIIGSGATVLVSIPNYFIGLALLYAFSFHYRVFPATGVGPKGFILPCTTLALVVMGMSTRVARASFAETASAEHVRVARSKGLGPRAVWWRHVVRNGLIPPLAMGGILFGLLMGGAVFVETIFQRPGIGRLAVSSITVRDFPVVQGVILTVAVAFIAINLLIDMVQAFLDPELRDSLHGT
jgi:ABC-type dipeptide/oligopeptide/nickel transport system permease component